MSNFEGPLKNLRIASPCSADWDAMYGDERKRFCGECKLNVYNLSGLTQAEAEHLVANAEGRLCVRFWQRRDGTVITQDCPVGWAKFKARTRVFATAIASLLVAMFTGVLFVSLFSRSSVSVGRLITPFTTPTPQPLMGAISVRPSPNREPAADVAEPSETGQRRMKKVDPETVRRIVEGREAS